MSEPKITNPEKTEKPKNPKRVEQGKRLAAISRQAKERKRQQQEKFFEPDPPEESKESAETEGSEEWDKLFWGIGLIGAAFLAYKIFLNPKTREDREDEDEFPEMRKVTVDSEEDEAQDEVQDEVQPQGKTRSTRSYEPYMMDSEK